MKIKSMFFKLRVFFLFVFLKIFFGLRRPPYGWLSWSRDPARLIRFVGIYCEREVNLVLILDLAPPTGEDKD